VTRAIAIPYRARLLSAAGLVLLACTQAPPPPLARSGTRPAINAIDPVQRLKLLVLPKSQPLPRDPTSRFADDPRAAALGHKFFFDTRFSGQLLDEANDGSPGTLGKRGEVGKVSCSSCHRVENRAFVDNRSPRHQLSLASGWTNRKTPSLLDVGHSRFLMWDGRHDTFFGQVFTPIESPVEFNSSRLFVAKQIERLYRKEYEAVFGPMPGLSEYPDLAAGEAGCAKLKAKSPDEICKKPGHDAEPVIRVVVNFGKAIQAYLRLLNCGQSRFDAWMGGERSALTADEQAGAMLFVGKGGCDTCHSGPFLTDQRFHNMGVRGTLIPFTGIVTKNDPGAGKGLVRLLADPLNSAGPFSDKDDGRLKTLPRDPATRIGAFRTPSLRCVSRRPSFMHDGQYRTLEDAVRFFAKGGASGGFLGVSENQPRNLSQREIEQLVLFLKALDGNGPDPAMLARPSLP